MVQKTILNGSIMRRTNLHQSDGGKFHEYGQSIHAHQNLQNLVTIISQTTLHIQQY